MKYVYLLQSVPFPAQCYIGITGDLNRRLEEHNSGKSDHTSRYRPWKIVTAVRFENDKRALAFEKYLKSGSGRSFANRHLWWAERKLSRISKTPSEHTWRV